MIVVANAGPLIALSKIGQLTLLPRLFGSVFLPLAVYEELVRRGKGRPGCEIADADWVQRREVEDETAIRLLKAQLDAGESEAIILAVQLGADLLLMDEGRGRRQAEVLGLRITGTVGILIAAKRVGLVEAVTPLLDELRAKQVRVSQRLYKAAQILAEEA